MKSNKFFKSPQIIFILLFSFIFSLNISLLQGQDTVFYHHFRPDTEQVITKLAFGSCSNQSKDLSYFDAIKKKNPDLFIWMGDIIYTDTEDMEKMKSDYDTLKYNSHYQAFIKDIPVIGVWDDHDYGVNDGNLTYPKKKESREQLFDFLDIDKEDPVRNHEGAYNSYTFGKGLQKVKIYLLDNRYFKSPLRPGTNGKDRYENDMTGTVLGDEQWKWLENEIENSDAEVNIFVSGIQIVPDDQKYEKWGNFPNERLRFLRLLENSKVKNPVILSGDRHFAELSEYTFENFEGSVLEVTSSGLTHSFEDADEYNAYRLGYLYDGKNFGMLQFYWGGTKLMYKIFIYKINGEEYIEHGVIGEY